MNAGVAVLGYCAGFAMQDVIALLSKAGMSRFGWARTGVWAGSSGKISLLRIMFLQLVPV